MQLASCIGRKVLASCLVADRERKRGWRLLAGRRIDEDYGLREKVESIYMWAF